MTDRLVLGTAQLGMAYGINNTTGKPDFEKACDVVKTAWECGVTRFDTAQAYGDSEEALGRVFDKFKLSTRGKVYTKLDPKIDLLDIGAVRRAVQGSLSKLKIDRLEGLFLHHEDNVMSWDTSLGETLQGLVKEGSVKSIGVSFYSPLKAFSALDINGIDLLQIPGNILDQRFERAGVFRKAQECRKDIFIRSVFLQGLLLMPLEGIPVAMKYVLPYVKRLEQMAADTNLSRQELCLMYVMKKWPDAFILFGADSRSQVVDNVRVASSIAKFEMDETIFKNVPEEVLNPVLWPKL